VGNQVSFSTQPGNVALDGTGRNSPFTGPLIKRIADPNHDILSILTEIRNEVLEETAGKQVPWENHALLSKFYFNSEMQINQASGDAQPQQHPRLPDPALLSKPGTGKIFRDSSMDGEPCLECPELVVIPSGRALIGSPPNEPQREHWKAGVESPQIDVKLEKPIAVGRAPVTFAEWDACVAGGGCNGHIPSDEGWGEEKGLF
jgi:formylglycine-generating enzyme required for sulfatase activity